ncbi:unnamed protein product [Ectocarpus sp. 12 AP-2014]
MGDRNTEKMIIPCGLSQKVINAMSNYLATRRGSACGYISALLCGLHAIHTCSTRPTPTRARQASNQHHWAPVRTSGPTRTRLPCRTHLVQNTTVRYEAAYTSYRGT